jgi:hypothetical protein
LLQQQVFPIPSKECPFTTVVQSLVCPISVSFGLQSILALGITAHWRQTPVICPLATQASWQVLSIVVVVDVDVEVEVVAVDTFLQILLTHLQSYPSGGAI